ncbi:MAG: FtsQ-type POTRA domain-containing protein [Neomegalonema sp.]|nr:FtsQ-type POTRA domain-containing protein [Neomegalonema sp.]
MTFQHDEEHDARATPDSFETAGRAPFWRRRFRLRFSTPRPAFAGRLSRAVAAAATRLRRPSPSTLALVTGAALGVALLLAPNLRSILLDGYTRVVGTLSSRPDFIIRKIAIDDAPHVSDAEIIAALGISDASTSSLSFDAHAARERIEAIGWVRAAEVRAKPPQLVEIKVTERSPDALWRRDGKLALIDASGAVIADDLDIAKGKFGGMKKDQLLRLPLIVGPGANTAAAEIIAFSAQARAAKVKVLSWTRIGDRRWDLELLDGPRIMLPEDAPKAALDQFLTWAKDTDLMKHGFQVIDFRDISEPKARRAG